MSDPHRRFNRFYRLTKQLGSGSFSVVKEAIHRQTNEEYAVKIITKANLSDFDKEALVHEIKIMQDLKHPNIILLFDYFEERHFHYLVMEKMMGGELFDRIVEKSFYTEVEARNVCRILFEALDYCHNKHQIAHRDLKPENLLLMNKSDDSSIKIADFGFAKKCEKPNSLRTRCGTPGYMAPDILLGKRYDTRADMWSMGVIVYTLLGGYSPFMNPNPKQEKMLILTGQFEFHKPFWGHVSEQAKDMIRSMLQIDSENRMTSAQAVSSAWILQDANDLAGISLGVNLEQLKKFNAKRRFKAAVKTVTATHKLSSLLSTIGVGAAAAEKSDDTMSSTPDYDAIEKSKKNLHVKTIEKETLTEDHEEVLQNEIKILRELQKLDKPHPNLLHLHNAFEDSKYHYLITDKTDGGDLLNRIVEKTAYNEYEAREICTVIFKAINHLHVHQIAHRNMKLENIRFVDNSDSSPLKIVDFRYAKKCTKPMSLLTQIGTPGYVSPEILLGTAYDTRVDMWSLGVVVYTILGGYFPFDDETPEGENEKIINASYTFPDDFWSQVSSEAKDLIKSLLTIDVNKRANCEQVLASHWITGDDEKLEKNDLATGLKEFKRSCLRNKFKASINTVMALNKLSLLVAFSKSEEDEEEAPDEALDIKQVSLDSLSREENEALRNEIQILNGLEHPNVIRLFSSFEEHPYYYVVTERVDGGDLLQRLQRKASYNEREALAIFTELLGAVQYCHSKSVAHLCLRLESVRFPFPNKDKRLKLVDFRFARKCPGPNCLTGKLDVPGAAPEIVRGHSYDTQADMWSLGVILFTMLAGYAPHDVGEIDLSKMDAEFDHVAWSHISESAKDFVKKLLTVDPNQRITADQAAGNQWVKE